METLRKVLLAVAVVVGILFGVSFALPSSWEVQREIEIREGSRVIHEMLTDLERWPEWVSWTWQDPTVRFSFEPVTVGEGAGMSWSSGRLTDGKIRITSSDEDEGVWYDMTYGRFEAKGAIQYVDTAEGTKLIWTQRADVKDPVGKYIARTVPYELERSMLEGLNRLKTRVELGR